MLIILKTQLSESIGYPVRIWTGYAATSPRVS